MKVCKDLDEFYRVNDEDINNILLKKFRNILQYYSLEDLKSDIYLRMLRKEYIQNYRPFEVEIDLENNNWLVKPSYAKFSTYICKFIFNYMYAYHNHLRPDWLCLSLDNYKDNNYSKDQNNKKINMEDNYDPFPNTDLKLDIEGILNYLKSKTQNTGTPIFDDSLLGNIAKSIDKYGEEGCPKDKLLVDISNVHFNNNFLSGMEEIIVSSVIKEAEKEGLIIEEKDDKHKTKYFINRNRRRSLYNLFKYYVNGYKDKEISEQFKMTVAGIGALKRSLRKEILEFYGNNLEN